MITKFNSLIGLFLGALVFVALNGYKIIDPTHIEWIMGAGDPGQHFLGWHFFRSEPWSFPLGVIKNYHYPSGTCLVFTDAIPLIGIPLKLFSSFLPQTFQYTGLWLLGSYMLQGLFASLLLQRFTKNSLLILLGTTFFLLSPIMFTRSGHHEALVGHWLILASLYLYFSSYTRSTKIKWVFLIIIASMVHFYLLVMVLVIWSGYILGYILSDSGKNNILKTIKYFLFTMTILILTMWIIGYFTIPFGSASTGGFGFYSMNMLSPFNPMGGGTTTFLNKFKMTTGGQHEGLNYFGFGLLLMMIAALCKSSNTIKDFKRNRHVPLIIIVIILYIYALSNKITFGSEVLVSFEYPWLLKDLGGILRASGRMFWPAYYIIMLTTIFIIIKYYSTKKSIFILSIFLIIQIIDFYPWYSSRDLNSRTWGSTLKSSDWGKIADSIDHIVMIPPIFDKSYSFPLYAANNNLDINIGYIAREDRARRSKYINHVMEKFSDDQLEDRTLYVIDKENLTVPNDQKKYLYGKLDGYNIIAPKDSNLELESYFDLSNILTQKISFDSLKVIFRGWSFEEKAHRWSLDKESKIIFSAIHNKKAQGLLSLNIGTLGEQEIKVSINDNYIGSQKINRWSKDIQFKFDPEILNKYQINIIQFEFPNAHKPNNDKRVLAMAIRSFMIE